MGISSLATVMPSSRAPKSSFSLASWTDAHAHASVSAANLDVMLSSCTHHSLSLIPSHALNPDRIFESCNSDRTLAGMDKQARDHPHLFEAELPLHAPLLLQVGFKRFPRKCGAARSAIVAKQLLEASLCGAGHVHVGGTPPCACCRVHWLRCWLHVRPGPLAFRLQAS
eukprot:359258-Chlamydomonas_euryale.AAC.4